MSATTLSVKSQITLPQPVRAALGLQVGDRIDFVADGVDGFRVVALKRDMKSIRGRFAGRVKSAVSLAAMERAMAEGASARYARSAL